jgi:hypothetical protein
MESWQRMVATSFSCSRSRPVVSHQNGLFADKMVCPLLASSLLLLTRLSHPMRSLGPRKNPPNNLLSRIPQRPPIHHPTVPKSTGTAPAVQQDSELSCHEKVTHSKNLPLSYPFISGAKPHLPYASISSATAQRFCISTNLAGEVFRDALTPTDKVQKNSIPMLLMW